MDNQCLHRCHLNPTLGFCLRGLGGIHGQPFSQWDPTIYRIYRKSKPLPQMYTRFYNMQLCKVKRQLAQSCYTCNTPIYLDYVDDIDFRSYIMVEQASVYVPGHPYMRCVIDNRVISGESPVRQISRPTSFIPSWKIHLCILYQVCGAHGASYGVRKRSDRYHTPKTVDALGYTHVYLSQPVIDSIFVGNLSTRNVHISTLTVQY